MSFTPAGHDPARQPLTVPGIPAEYSKADASDAEPGADLLPCHALSWGRRPAATVTERQRVSYGPAVVGSETLQRSLSYSKR